MKRFASLGKLPPSGAPRLLPARLLCVALCCTLHVAVAQQYFFQISSQPQTVIPTTNGYEPPGVLIQTPNFAPGVKYNGYCFGYWTLNGVRQADPATGLSLNTISLNMTNVQYAQAIFFPPGNATVPGLPDWWQSFWFGNTNQAGSADPTGDGFTLADDLARGYSPVITNATVSGGEVLRLSEAATLAGGPAQYSFAIGAQPQGVIPATNGLAPRGTLLSTPDLLPGTSYGGYYFGYWSLNGVRQSDPVTGLSLSVISLDLTNDQVATAVFFLPDVQTVPGLPDWWQSFWFGNTNQAGSADPTGDGFTLADDLARGYSPVITNATVSGGEVLRLSEAATLAGGPAQYSFAIGAQPQGVIPATNGLAPRGTFLSTPDLLPGTSYGGYYFGYWSLNGVRQSDPVAGLSLSTISLDLTNDQVATAVFFLPDAQTVPGLPDWWQSFWFGNTNQAGSADPTGDGFTLADDLARGYSPVITNATVSGGEVLRLSEAATLAGGPAQYSFAIGAQPQGVIPATNGLAPRGTLLSTPDLLPGTSYGGYYFGYWSLNGVRQSDPVTGLSLSTISLDLTNDQVATAVFFLPDAQTVPGLPDWWQSFWFGNTNQAGSADPTGDGFTLADDLARDYSPVITNATVSGGEVLRLSEVGLLFPPPYYQSVNVSTVDGSSVISWSPGGILQSAPSVSGPYTDVPGAAPPYTEPISGSQFFRVWFPQ